MGYVITALFRFALTISVLAFRRGITTGTCDCSDCTDDDRFMQCYDINDNRQFTTDSTDWWFVDPGPDPECSQQCREKMLQPCICCYCCTNYDCCLCPLTAHASTLATSSTVSTVQERPSTDNVSDISKTSTTETDDVSAGAPAAMTSSLNVVAVAVAVSIVGLVLLVLIIAVVILLYRRRSVNRVASETQRGSASLGSASATGNIYTTIDLPNLHPPPPVTSPNVAETDGDVTDHTLIDNDLYEH